MLLSPVRRGYDADSRTDSAELAGAERERSLAMVVRSLGIASMKSGISFRTHEDGARDGVPRWPCAGRSLVVENGYETASVPSVMPGKISHWPALIG